jgi:hypothetical protein
LLVCGGFGTNATAQRDMRVRPPAQVNCARDRYHLTSYTGVVVQFERGTDRTTLRINTDWDTTEDVEIVHKGSDPARWFLFRGNPFVQGDWSRITDADGRLRKGTRASAWVCSDGTNPVVDWEAPRE